MPIIPCRNNYTKDYSIDTALPSKSIENFFSKLSTLDEYSLNVISLAMLS